MDSGTMQISALLKTNYYMMATDAMGTLRYDFTVHIVSTQVFQTLKWNKLCRT